MSIRFNRMAKYYYLRFRRLKGDPYALAFGTAIGVFVGLTPTMPLHTVSILILAFLTRTSAIAGILSSWLVCNPLTYIPIYYFSTVIGNAVTPYELNWDKIQTVVIALTSSDGITHSLQILAGLGFEALIVLLAGGCLLALPFTLVSYYISLYTFLKIRAKRQEKHVLK
jgi:uncharacterized protein